MTENSEKILPVFIEEEMKSSYIDYSMSVIVARALPDVRDGLKPVHRRVLFGMLGLGIRPNSPYKKSARIVGEVLGKYHPHGDTAVYDAMVRMVQDFSLRYPLVDGQGNFGSIDGDAPAAMRYTEARLASISDEVLRDIEKDTVDFVPNFDDSLKEPLVLPALLPTLLVNGAAGIAVGMATNIPPHNLREVVDALVAVIEKPDLKPEEVRKYMKGPDFPTGAIISGDEEIAAYFKHGRGKLTVRARVHVEDVSGGRHRIVVTEIPYQVNKTSLIERVAEMVREKKIDGLYDIRDESDRDGMRIVFELRKEADAEAVLKDLFRYTQMQTTFGVILLALVDGQPKVLNVKQMLAEFLKFRHEVILRRCKYELEKAEQRAHILEGLKIALDNIDAIIALIKKSKDVDTARKGLIKTFKLSEIQAQAILDMRLQRLTGLERKKIEDEYKELIKLIQRLKSLLASKSLRMQLIKQELLELKEHYGDNRRTQILTRSSNGAQSLEEMVSDEEFIIALTRRGRIGRFSPVDYSAEAAAGLLGEKDYLRFALRSVNSQLLLFVSRSGRAYLSRTSFIPLASEEVKGGEIGRLLHFKEEEEIIACFAVPKQNGERYLFLATRQGLVKKINFEELQRIKEGGLAVVGLRDEDLLIGAGVTDGKTQVLLATQQGKSIRFSEEDVRDMGAAAGGIKGIELEQKDQVISLALLQREETAVMSVTRLGFGKRTALEEYSIIKRGGKGIVNNKCSEKSGEVAAVLESRVQDIFVVVTKKGKLKRIKAKEIKMSGRGTQGAALVNIVKGDEIVSAFVVPDPQSKKRA
ncbi:MAG TPA: DNA gyrase subunit A [bacterium]|nr:DNA gyrase subunit A [bacterium]HPR86508.1 DNA gyrase subunit A [bacterium]